MKVLEYTEGLLAQIRTKEMIYSRKIPAKKQLPQLELVENAYMKRKSKDVVIKRKLDKNRLQTQEQQERPFF